MRGSPPPPKTRKPMCVWPLLTTPPTPTLSISLPSRQRERTKQTRESTSSARARMRYVHYRTTYAQSRSCDYSVRTCVVNAHTHTHQRGAFERRVAGLCKKCNNVERKLQNIRCAYWVTTHTQGRQDKG